MSSLAFLHVQVVDWEEGGRTTATHVQRIFQKEQSAGPNRVQAIIHRYPRFCQQTPI